MLILGGFSMYGNRKKILRQAERAAALKLATEYMLDDIYNEDKIYEAVADMLICDFEEPEKKVRAKNGLAEKLLKEVYDEAVFTAQSEQDNYEDDREYLEAMSGRW